MDKEQTLIKSLNGLSIRVNNLANKLGHDPDKHEIVHKELLIDRLVSEILVIEETVCFIQDQIYKIEE